MAQHLFLHIGQPKTGSTALQKALAAHPHQLAAAGVVYPVADGRYNHCGEVADLQVGRTKPTAGNTAGYARLLRQAVPGSWERIVGRVTSSGDNVVLSDETMSSLPRAAAERVVGDLTRDSRIRATAILVVRPLSDLLASAYAQLAQDTLLPGFEVWTRAWLGTRLRRPESDSSNDWTNGFRVARVWQSTGAEVVCVKYQANSSDYWDDVLKGLGLAEVRDQIVIPRANPSMSALGLAAWQQYLRSGVVPFEPATKRLRKAARAGLPEVCDASLGGRLSLTRELAELVDGAFPQPPSGTFSTDDANGSQGAPSRNAGPAIALLEERLRDARPLTTQPLADRHDDVAALANRIHELAGHG